MAAGVIGNLGQLQIGSGLLMCCNGGSCNMQQRSYRDVRLGCGQKLQRCEVTVYSKKHEVVHVEDSDGIMATSVNGRGHKQRSEAGHNLSWRKNVVDSMLLNPQSDVQSKRTRGIMCATVDDIEAEKELIEEDAMERMDKTLETVKGNFNTIRTGRASPSLLDRVEVEYYGTPVTLKSIAQVSTPDGSTILVQPFDKSSLASIEKAIIKSDLSLTPSNDGSVIRLNIPQLTADRRKELLKTVSKLSEEGKVAIRNVRRDAIKSYEKLEKDKKLSQDNVKDLSDEIQKLTDDYVKKIDVLFKQKEKELTTV